MHSHNGPLRIVARLVDGTQPASREAASASRVVAIQCARVQMSTCASQHRNGATVCHRHVVLE